MNREAEEFRISSDIKEANNEVLRGRLEQAEALLREAEQNIWHPGVMKGADTLSQRLNEFLASQQVERNQCDGCQAGIPLVDGAHRMGRPGGYPDLMSCQNERYEHPEQAEGAQFSTVNDWFLSLDQGRQHVLREDKWMLADAAFRAGMEARAALAQPSPAPELERPEVVAFLMKPDTYEPYVGLRRDGTCDCVEPLMTVAQHDRIVGALRAESQKHLSMWATAVKNTVRAEKERDAAQARVAELETQEPIGKCLTEDEMGIGFDRRAGPVIWFGTPKPGFIYADPVARAGQAPEEWRDMLKTLQWHYCDYDEYWHRAAGYYCPQCGGGQADGHKDGCELAALIAAAPAQGGRDE